MLSNLLTPSQLESTIHKSFQCTSGVNGRYAVRIYFNGAWRRVRSVWFIFENN